MRVFIAVDLSTQAKREIEKLFKKLEKKHWPVKWVEPDKLHLTLVFFKNIDEKLTERLKTACQKAVINISPFSFSFKGLGAFPGYDYVRVIWLGLKGDLKTLAELQKKTAFELKKAGFEFDERKFVPHLTLGRIRGCSFNERQEIGRQLKAMRLIDFKSQVLINSLVVYQSKLSPKGAVYKKLGIIELPEVS